MEARRQMRERSASVLHGTPVVPARCLLMRLEDEGMSLGYSPQEGNRLSGISMNKEEMTCYIVRRGCVEVAQLKGSKPDDEPPTYTHPTDYFREVICKRRTNPAEHVSSDGQTFQTLPNSIRHTAVVYPAHSLGFQCWFLSCSSLEYLTIGIASMIGCCSTVPEYTAALKKSVSSEGCYKIYSKNPCAPDEVDAKDLNIPLHALVGSQQEEVSIAVSIDFDANQISFLVEGTLVGSVYVVNMTGEYTLLVTSEQGGRATLTNITPCCYLPLTSSRYLAGSPYNRRESVDGVGREAAFRFPLGSAYNSVKRLLYVGDRDLIRVIDVDTSEVVSKRIVQPHNYSTCREPDFLRVLTWSDQGLSIYDGLSGTWLLVDVDTWGIVCEYHGQSVADIDERNVQGIAVRISGYDTAYGCYGIAVGGTMPSIESLRGDVEMWGYGCGGCAYLNGWWFLSLTGRSVVVAIPPEGKPYVLLGTLDRPGRGTGWGETCLLTHPTAVTAYTALDGSTSLLVVDTGCAAIFNAKLRSFQGAYDAFACPLVLTGTEGSGVDVDLMDPLGLCMYEEGGGLCFLVADTADDTIWSIGPLACTTGSTKKLKDLPEAAVWQYFSKYLLGTATPSAPYSCQSANSFISNLRSPSPQLESVTEAVSELLLAAAYNHESKLLASILSFNSDLVDHKVLDTLAGDKNLIPEVMDVIEDYCKHL